MVYAATRSGGAMNSGPTGSLIVSCRMRSISRHRSAVDMPADDVGDRRELVGAPRAPQCDIPFAAIEYPSHGEMDHPPAVMFLRELVQSLDRGKILFEARRDEISDRFCAGRRR